MRGRPSGGVAASRARRLLGRRRAWREKLTQVVAEADDAAGTLGDGAAQWCWRDSHSRAQPRRSERLLQGRAEERVDQRADGAGDERHEQATRHGRPEANDATMPTRSAPATVAAMPSDATAPDVPRGTALPGEDRPRLAGREDAELGGPGVAVRRRQRADEGVEPARVGADVA